VTAAPLQGKAYALVLAGGAGSRFGGGKLLAAWRGGVLLDGALAAAFAAPVAGVTLVTGADADRVAAAARALAARSGQGDRLTVVHAADHAEGMAATLRAGVAALPQNASAAVVFLGDMPLIPAGVSALLIDALAAGAPAAVPVFEGRRGNPAAFGRALFPQVADLRGDEGARRILIGLGDQLACIPIDDPGVVLDVDRAADLPD
jgi:molybdenum cofactor cytidylyltransferase